MGSAESKYKEKTPLPYRPPSKDKPSAKRQQPLAPKKYDYHFKDLIMTGSQCSEGEITYDSHLQANPSLQSLERGFAIQSFSTRATKHNIPNEFLELKRITQDEKLKQQLWVDGSLMALNRYNNILPYKRNCVRIPRDETGNNTYINASYVSSSMKGDDKSFIVCQSPLENTIADFWKMIINEKVHTIIMLCKLEDQDQIQCSKYFPDVKDAIFKPFEGVTLRVKAFSTSTGITERRFTVKVGEGKTREVAHYQWEGWPDHGVPTRGQYKTVLHLLEKIVARRSKGARPIVVHCSAGVGRSGALVALHNLAQIIKSYQENKAEIENEDKWRLSVFSTVRRLREQRFGMVQTTEQYEFIYDFVQNLLKQN